MYIEKVTADAAAGKKQENQKNNQESTFPFFGAPLSAGVFAAGWFVVIDRRVMSVAQRLPAGRTNSILRIVRRTAIWTFHK